MSLAESSRPLRTAMASYALMVFTPKLHHRIFNDVRPAIQYIGSHLRGNLVGCEVGIERGYNAKNILSYLPMKHLYLVDPYLTYFVEGEDSSTFYSKAQSNLKNFQNKTFLKLLSSEALCKVPNNLDFVYIDACHAYESVKYDVSNWYGKVREGGIVAGHDINLKGVLWAVTEFAKAKNLDLFTEKYDWWFIKGRHYEKHD